MSHGRETTAIFHPATSSFKKPQSNERRTDQAVGSGALFGDWKKLTPTRETKGEISLQSTSGIFFIDGFAWSLPEAP